MKYAGFILVILFMLVFNGLPLPGQGGHESSKPPKNIILMIGDGMGISQLSSVYYFKDEKDADREPSFASTNHSAALVPVFAYGPGAENFMGVYENTDIFHKLVALFESE